ncbi:hypothetical protein ACMFMG_005400 [Clarireedia jacksonii]
MDVTPTTGNPTPSPLLEISDLQLHSCTWCRKIVIDPNAAVKLGSHSYGITFEFKVEDIGSASRDGCPIFKHIRHDMNSCDDLTSDTVLLLIELRYATAEPSDHSLFHVRVSGHMKAPISTSNPVETYTAFSQAADNGTDYGTSVQNDDPTADLVDQSVRLPYVIMDETYRRLREDLEICDEIHTECRGSEFRSGSESPWELPSRLVKIDNLSNNVQIVPASDHSGIKFAALSYCWGGDDSMKLTRTNVEPWSRSVPRSELPKTLCDAITFTKKVGLQYIWIDRLCIIQDDEKDKAREIARMPGIFHRAYVTISATDASSCAEGFLQNFNDLSEKVQSEIALQYTRPDGVEGIIILDELKDKPRAQGSVDLRAWTLQEQKLSRRLISCKYNSIKIQCLRSAKSHEVRVSAPHGMNYVTTQLPGSQENFLIRPRVSGGRDVMQEWNELVALYSQRQLSHPEDKLPALSAIAEFFSAQLRMVGYHSLDRAPKYLAGQWDSQFPAALLWTIAPTSLSLFMSHTLSPRPPTYRAPSWSWAAVDDAIRWSPSVQTAHVFSLIILDAETTPKHSFAPYGEITAARLRVKGKLMEGMWHCVEDYSHSTVRNLYFAKIKGDETWRKSIKVLPDSRDEDILRDGSDPQIVYFLEVGSKIPYGSSGLIIIPVQNGVYRRIGMFEDSTVGIFEGARCQEMILV